MKRLFSMLMVAALLVSILPVVFPTTAASNQNVMSVQPRKLELELQQAIQEQAKKDPNGEIRIVIVLNDLAEKTGTIDLLGSLGAKINSGHNIINAISASVSAQNIEKLTALPDVEKVLLDKQKYIIPVQSDDSYIAIENYLANYPYWYSQFPWWIEANKVWDEGITGAGVTVGIIDTGVFYDHPDLAGVVVDHQIFTSEEEVPEFDNEGHGTSCAGTLASQGIVDWDLGAPPTLFKVKGVAPGAKILAAKCFTAAGYGWDTWIINGIEWAVENGANVISGSFGGLEIPNDGNDPTSLALEAAIDKGVTVFIAAANSQGQSTVTSPGCSTDIITVGASTENSFPFWWLGYWPTAYADGYENDQVIHWSSEGPTADGRTKPDVCAIGAWGLTLDTYPWYLNLQFGGTSMATPMAAGVGALVIEAFTAAHGRPPKPQEVKSILMSTAKDLGYPANKQGAGRVDAYQAYLAAITVRSYADKSVIDTGVVPRGSSDFEKISFTQPIDSVTATTFETIGSVEFLGLSGKVRTDVFIPFTVPEGTEYIVTKTRFDPEITFGGPVKAYDGSQWKDAHARSIIYRIEEGRWILIDYSYAHTNTQWCPARAGPGEYVLVAQLQGYGIPTGTIIQFDAEITFMHQVSWEWISTHTMGNDLYAKISVPKNASPGPHSGFIKVVSGGSPIIIPVTVNVPACLKETFTAEFNAAYIPREGVAGDWKFFTVACWYWGDITLTVSWTDPNTDFDVFLIDPDGNVEALSMAPSAPIVKPSGGGRVYYTSTETTMELLTASCAKPGYWTIGVWNIFFGKIFSETVTIKLAPGKPIETPCWFYLKSGQTKTFTARNKVPGTLTVDTMVLSFCKETISFDITGTIYPEDEAHAWAIPITPDVTKLEASLNWAGDAKLSLILWDPAGADRAVAFEKEEKIGVTDPTIGYWTVMVTVNEYSVVDYTITVTITRYKPFDGVEVTPDTFALAPLGEQTITVTADPDTMGTGLIVFYNFATGSIYSKTLLTVLKMRGCACRK